MTFEEKVIIVQRLFDEQDESKFDERIDSELNLMAKIVYETKDCRIDTIVHFPFIEKKERFLVFMPTIENLNVEDLRDTLTTGILTKLNTILQKYGGAKKFPNFQFKLGYGEEGLIFTFFYCSNDYEEQMILNVLNQKGCEI